MRPRSSSPDRADVLGAQAQPRARHQGAGHLPAGADDLFLERHLAGIGREVRHDEQRIGGVEAHAHHVEFRHMPLVSMRQLLDEAAKGGYGVGAFNVNNMEQIQAIMEAARETKSPVIVQASRGARPIRRTIFCIT
jgi:hypothetical protein